MTVGPQHEAPQAASGEGFSDAVTFAFGDDAADVYAVARVGFSGEHRASGLGLVFAGGEPVAVQADGAAEVDERAWEAIDAAGLATSVQRPLQAWALSFAADGATFDLQVEAASAPAELNAHGMEGYEQLCRVTGDATIAGRRLTLDCAGQRGHSWGTPDWDRIELTRTLGVWLDDGLGASLFAIQAAGVSRHDAETVTAYLYEAGEPARVLDPRLSTAYDGEGRQRRAGLELWVDEDSAPRRAAGEVVCGTSLDLGRLRLDCTFLRWRMEGRDGVGRYDILRRAG